MSQSSKRDDTVESPSVGRQRKAQSGEYPRAQHSTFDDDLVFANLSADIDAAVDRMQKQLDECGEQTLQDTSEIAPIEDDAVVPSARFKVDGSVVPSPRTSLIRELRPNEDATGTQAFDLEPAIESEAVESEGAQTVEAPNLVPRSEPRSEVPVFEKTLLGPSLDDTRESPKAERSSELITLEQPGQGDSAGDTYQGDDQTAVDDQFYQDDDILGYDDGHTEIDNGDGFEHEDDITSPSRAYQIAGRELDYDPSEIDQVVQFHEGPTGVSMQHHLQDGPSDTEERMHPWFDSAPVRAPLARNSGPATKRVAPSQIPPGFSHPLHTQRDETSKAAKQATQPFAQQADVFLRTFLEKCSTTTLEVNLGYLLIGLAALGLFVATTFVVWLIASP